MKNKESILIYWEEINYKRADRIEAEIYYNKGGYRNENTDKTVESGYYICVKPLKTEDKGYYIERKNTKYKGICAIIRRSALFNRKEMEKLKKEMFVIEKVNVFRNMIKERIEEDEEKEKKYAKYIKEYKKKNNNKLVCHAEPQPSLS